MNQILSSLTIKTHCCLVGRKNITFGRNIPLLESGTDNVQGGVTGSGDSGVNTCDLLYRVHSSLSLLWIDPFQPSIMWYKEQ